MKAVSLVLLFAVQALATVYFSEDFSGDWQSRWVNSKNKESEGTQGVFKVSAGKFYNDAEADKGLQTSQDARFYQISAKFPKFSNKGKTLYLQYSIKHEQNIDCGGGYLKIHPHGIDQANYNGDTQYNIMFGPDICGSSTKRTHVIFSNKGTNHLIKKEVRAESDELTHLYTLILHPDNTFQVNIDGKEASKGSLKEDFDILPPKEINDPAAKKPADWVDERQIADPTDKKPEDWDNVPKEIKDPDAKKPDDWDDELDGVWEAPMIANPDYKGEWRARMIDNPAYKGEWVHPKIANPDYKDDDTLYQYEDNGAVGIEIWQVKAGSIFDNILITDDAAEAEKWAAKTVKTQEGEKKMKEKADEEERKRREAEEAASKKDEDSHEGHNHDHDKDEL
jgi:calreticulin